MVYTQLNLFKQQESMFFGMCWCPVESEQDVIITLQQITKDKPHIASGQLHPERPPALSTPPTYFKTNDVTGPFQEIVNTYAIPRYGEINPGLFYLATFPFLFGVMFGDIAHGGLLFAFGNIILAPLTGMNPPL